MRTLMRNILYGLRMLRKSPGMTLAVVATLMLGIGATTAIYTVVYAVLLAPLPYPHPDQLMIVWSKVTRAQTRCRPATFSTGSSRASLSSSWRRWYGSQFNLSTQDQPEPSRARLPRPGRFSMQGIPFLMGRDFLPEEGFPGQDQVVVLTTNCGTGSARIAASSANDAQSKASRIPWSVY